MAEETVNDQINEELIEHDVQLQRVIGGEKNDIEKRLDRLAADIKAEAARIDPFAAQRTDARERRLKKLEVKISELTVEAYKDIAREHRNELRRAAAVETERQVTTIEKALP